MPGFKSLLLVAVFGHGGSSQTIHGHTPDRDLLVTDELSSLNYKNTVDDRNEIDPDNIIFSKIEDATKASSSSSWHERQPDLEIEQDVMAVSAAETCNFTTGAKVAEHMNNILVSPIYLQLSTVLKQIDYLHLQIARYVDLIKTCEIIDEEAVNALAELMDFTAESEIEEGIFDCEKLTSKMVLRKGLYEDHCDTLNHSNILQYVGAALDTAAFRKMDTDRHKMCYTKRVVERYAGMIGVCDVRDEDIGNAMDELLDYCRVLGVEETMTLAECDTLTKCLEKPAGSGLIDESSTNDLKHESKEFDLQRDGDKSDDKDPTAAPTKKLDKSHKKKEISAAAPTTKALTTKAPTTKALTTKAPTTKAPTESEDTTATPKSETKKTSSGRYCTDFTVTKVMDHIDATITCNVYNFLKTNRMKACFVQFAIDRFEDIVKSCDWKTESVRYAIDGLIDFGQVLMTGEGIDRDYCEKNNEEEGDANKGEASFVEEREGSGGVRGHHLVDEDGIANLNTLISEVYELIGAHQEETRGEGKKLLL